MYLPILVIVFALLSSIETIEASVIKENSENLKVWEHLEAEKKEQINSHRYDQQEIRGNTCFLYQKNLTSHFDYIYLKNFNPFHVFFLCSRLKREIR